MGYQTYFDGEFNISPPLTQKDNEFLTKLAGTRRMKRKGLGKEFGKDGEFFVDGGGDAGQADEPSVVDFNTPPGTQPGLWCLWVPTEDGKRLVWDEGEKFYEYVPWIKYLIVKILEPRGYTVHGEVFWEGEESGDKGIIVVKKNKVSTRKAKPVSYGRARRA